MGESAVYGFGGMANQALGIVLVPIYARALGVEAYGTVALLTATLSLTNLVVTLALPQAFLRSYLNEAESSEARAEALRTALGLRLLVSAIALGLVSALSLPLAVALFGSAEEMSLVALIGPIVFLDTLNLVPLSVLRADRRPKTYAALSFSRAVLGSVLIIGCVVGLGLGAFGVVLGSLGSALLVSTAGVLLLVREGRFSVGIDRPLARHMLRFSLPLVPASIAGWTLNLSDRYVLGAIAGREAVGVYSAGYTVGLAINALAIAPFSLAWGAAFWEISRQDDARIVIARVLTGFTAIASFMALALSAFGTDAIRLLLTPGFEAGRFVVPFSAFAYVLFGVFTIVSTGLNIESQTRRVPVVLAAAAAANLALNLLLVPILGFLGSAIATLVSYAALAVAAGIVSQHYYAVPWEARRVAALLAVGMGLAALALVGPDQVYWRLICVAAFPALTVGLRIVPPRLLGPAIARIRPR